MVALAQRPRRRASLHRPIADTMQANDDEPPPYDFGMAPLSTAAFQDCACGELRLSIPEMSSLLAVMQKLSSDDNRCTLIKESRSFHETRVRRALHRPAAEMPRVGLRLKRVPLRRRRLPKAWFYDAAMVKRRDQIPPAGASSRRPPRPPGAWPQRAAPAAAPQQPTPRVTHQSTGGESPTDIVASSGGVQTFVPAFQCAVSHPVGTVAHHRQDGCPGVANKQVAATGFPGSAGASFVGGASVDLRNEVEVLRTSNGRLAKDIEAMRQSKRSQRKMKQESRALTDEEKAALQEKIDCLDGQQLNRALELLQREKQIRGLADGAQDEVQLDIDSLPYSMQKRFLKFVDVEYKRRRRRRQC